MSHIVVMMLDSILTQWNRAPSTPRRDYSAWPNREFLVDGDEPISELELRSMKREFKRLAPTHYAKLFGRKSGSTT